MDKVRKFWFIFGACFLLSWHFVGNAIYADLAYGFGFLSFAGLIGSVLVYRAKNFSAVVGGHTIHIILLLGMCFIAYNDGKEDGLKSLFDGCLNTNQRVVSSELPDSVKVQFCTCLSSGFSPIIGNTVILDIFLFKKTLPIEYNSDLQKVHAEVWAKCEAKI